MRYGNANAPAVTSTDVWTNGYVGVWHMNAAEGTFTQNDSTLNGNNLATSSSHRSGMLCGVEGAVGTAAEMGRNGVKTGGFSVLDSANVLDGFTNMTLEVWTYQSSYAAEARYLFNKQDPQVNKSAYYFQQKQNTEGRIAAYIYKVQDGTEAASGVWQGNTYPGAQLNEWTHQVFRWSGETGRTSGFLNGIIVNEQGAHGSRTGVGIQVGGRFYVGNYFPNQEKVFPGKFDEVRVSNVARSDDWVVATHDTIANTSFASFELQNDWSQYAHKFTIAFTNYTGSTTLENFPVLVKISEAGIPGFHYADCVKARGADLRFTDGNSSTPLPCEVEVWNPEGESLIWVKVPELKAGTRITAYYGWDFAPAVVATDVWDANYLAVWHMDAESGETTQLDATVNNRTLSLYSEIVDTVAPGVQGVLGKAAAFDQQDSHLGAYEYLGSGGKLSGMKTLTIEVWAKQEASASNNRHIIMRKDTNVSYDILQYPTTTAAVYYPVVDGAATYLWGESIATPIGEWNHFAALYDGDAGSVSVFMNGTGKTVAKTDALNNSLRSVNGSLYIGNYDDRWSPYAFPGSIDEVRLSKVARSDDWVKATHDTIALSARYSSAGDNTECTIVIFR